MTGRTYSATGVGKYRYGFNGKEKDDEVNVDGGSYDFGARIYDGRLGRWLSRDPFQKKYPSLSSYNFCANNPIVYIDKEGKEIINPYDQKKEEDKVNYLKVQTAINIFAAAMPELYKELHGDPNFKISIYIDDLDPNYDEDAFINNTDSKKTMHSDYSETDDLGSCENRYKEDGQVVIVKDVEDPEKFKIYWKEFNDITDVLDTKEITFEQLMGKISLGEKVTIKLEDGLKSQKKLGEILAHELTHFKFNKDNAARALVDKLTIPNKYSEYEKAAEKGGNLFLKLFKKLTKEVKKNAEPKLEP